MFQVRSPHRGIQIAEAEPDRDATGVVGRVDRSCAARSSQSGLAPAPGRRAAITLAAAGEHVSGEPAPQRQGIAGLERLALALLASR